MNLTINHPYWLPDNGFCWTILRPSDIKNSLRRHAKLDDPAFFYIHQKYVSRIAVIITGISSNYQVYVDAQKYMSVSKLGFNEKEQSTQYA